MAEVIGGLMLLGLLIAFAWWLLIETEGVYLGRRVVIALYDLYAKRYDTIKDFQPEYEFALLAAPIMTAIAPQKDPMVLDVATGTGRLPLALLRHARFDGRVVGVDLSVRMLHIAADKLAEDNAYVDLVRTSADDLPFHNACFDVVTFLESLEFMPDIPGVIAEMARVVRPGGLLLITNRINTRWMPGKTFSNDGLTELLHDHGFVNVQIEPWQEDYHRVWAVKAGESEPMGAVDLWQVLTYTPADLHVDEAGIVHM